MSTRKSSAAPSRRPRRPDGASPASSSVRSLDRYREIVPDWPLFLAAADRPLPYDGHVNSLRAEPTEVLRRLAGRGIRAVAMEWDPCAFRADRPLGTTLEHWLGLYYVQEAVQAVPVLALDPQPGERVLDLCAAPGGKTVHIAGRMANSGVLVANEPNGRRQQALLANLNRAGAWNAVVTEYRGQDLPLGDSFDRVLIDAPCSGEGTLRKEPTLRDGASPFTIERLARLQVRLILRGFDLLRTGGTLVYSTCTLAPEENEAVVASLLAARDARVIPVELPFPHAPGLAGWRDACFPDAVQGCTRIYPQHLDSGGGFVARVQRVA
ncbi:MAG: RsmB/NOP family class I SAM-dependent RNA methyltransferase [Candidatus Bipolaricaulota bacterium]